MKQSLEDVAKIAGVSTATVSRALRDLDTVRPETKARIRRIAMELGYVTSPFATSLATGRTRTVGIVTPWINRWFFSNVIEGAERTLRAHGMDALLYSFQDNLTHQLERLDPDVLRRRVDAVLILGMPLRPSEVADLESLGIPLVFVGTGHRSHVTVRVDDGDIAELAMGHLFSLGHRNVGHLTGTIEEDSSWSAPGARQDGWRASLLTQGIQGPEDWCANGDFLRSTARAATHELLERAPELTAIFAASDDMAVGAIEALWERGLEPGAEFSIVGVDGTEAAELMGITTIVQDPVAQGAAATSALLGRLEGIATPLEILGEVRLVSRSSTGTRVKRL